ncbi:glycine betaine/L-proline ABC transporter permease ProW [Diaphorobacter aerolatus]|uniref:Glycine betaine/L-proline ABC transporter permease ProW n=1 Tax=Diaphorobacter aerolatus TaxID=1288495 RepID=A0A7H0GJ17_9BURK|nr:glycine betaine/L-proline ABC transporter permease ProW [Diaphorobacter aerolatus]QNP48283.1 glycine betaine/L-proline ABC transporter permease ProW [Diaphorobacter aerolatus]
MSEKITIAQNTNPEPTAADPWADASPPSTPVDAAITEAATVDPWATPDSGAADPMAGADWLEAAAGNAPLPGDEGGMAQLWSQVTAGGPHVQGWINDGLTWVVEHFRPFFQSVRTPIDATLNGITDALLVVPWPVLLIVMALLAWQFAGRGLAIGTAVSLLLIAVLGIWPDAMVTLALVLTSLLFCVIIGLPAGICLASSDRAQRITRPFLDAMQTTPAFVYLVPVVMLFGIGNVPGVIVTIVFALPPLIRLTNLGIRQVRPDLIEASRAYGASPMQLLWKVQLPLAMPSIMAGINQALMLSLSMVVIASMIAVGGLGQMVLRGIGRLDMGLATVGGLGIVLLAIVLDRITQAMGQNERGGVRWWQTGPTGRALRIARPRSDKAAHMTAVPPQAQGKPQTLPKALPPTVGEQAA